MTDQTRRAVCGRRLGSALLALIVCAAVVAGCGAPPQQQRPVPTVAPVFGNVSPGPAATMGTAPLVPTPEPPPSGVVSSRTGANLEAIPIYDDRLGDDWTLDESTLVRLDPESQRVVKDGRSAIEVDPSSGYGTLLFAVRPDARRRYSAEQIVGVRFWVNGGPNAIGPEDLLITVMGSNAYPYWRPNDTSVSAAGRITDGGTIFDEQRIFFLGFEKGIPAYTWAEITIWLDERILDPEYAYFTGLYIKNDEYFVKPYFVDSVSLLVPRT